MAKANWETAYAVRQEYNQEQDQWFPIIFYWNRSPAIPRAWIECLCTESGNSYYHTELTHYNYCGISKPRTDKCNPDHVAYLLSIFRTKCAEWGITPVEVQKLGTYRP